MSPPPPDLRVLLAHHNLAEGIRLAAVLKSCPGLGLSHRARDLTEAYHLAEHTVPDVILIAEGLIEREESALFLALLAALGIGCAVVAGEGRGRARLEGGRWPTRIGTVLPAAGPGPLLRTLRQVAAEAALARPRRNMADPRPFGSRRVILIGASTGGVEAMLTVLSAFPGNCPPTVVVQHTGGRFTQGLSRLLSRHVTPCVREAEDGLRLKAGQVVIAPGDERHLILRDGVALRCALATGDRISGHRPSVDALFRSAVPIARRVSAAILTGMGRDGAEGLLALRHAGAATFGQDEFTSIVYGMPRVAQEIGAVGAQLPLDRIGPALLSSCQVQAA